MPSTHLPPMTSRQVKKTHKKTAGQFQFTASQMRRADRREERERRKQMEEERERKRKDNKRKRDEQEEKDRAAKRRLIEEGKITVEDTWGKVTSSQPRLNAFFRKPSLPLHLTTQKTSAEQDGRGDNDENVLLQSELGEEESDDPNVASCDSNRQAESEQTCVSHEETTKLSSLGVESRKSIQSDQVLDKSLENVLRDCCSTASKLAALDQDTLDEQLSLPQGFWDFLIAEDETAGPQPTPSTIINHHSNDNGRSISGQANQDSASVSDQNQGDSLFSSSQKSSRSILSEMSPSKVNIRAQEKPDTSSAPGYKHHLPSPQMTTLDPGKLIDETLAFLNTQDLNFDEDEILEDKENKDPWKETSKQSPVNADVVELSKNPTPLKKEKAPVGFGDFSDCEDMFDFDDDDDNFDDGLDDEVFENLPSTQKKNKTILIDPQGSPRKSSPVQVRTAEDEDLARSMLPPLLKNKSPSRIQPNDASKLDPKVTLSFGYDDADDDDFVAIADEVESPSNSTEKTPQRRKRTLPWIVNPPPSTQDLMVALVDDLEELT